MSESQLNKHSADGSQVTFNADNPDVPPNISERKQTPNDEIKTLVTAGNKTGAEKNTPKTSFTYEPEAHQDLYRRLIRPLVGKKPTDKQIVAFGRLVSACVRNSNNIRVSANRLRSELGRNWEQHFGALIERGDSYSTGRYAKNFSVDVSLVNAMDMEFRNNRPPSKATRTNGKRPIWKAVNKLTRHNHGELHNIPARIPLKLTELEKFRLCHANWLDVIGTGRPPTYSATYYGQLREKMHAEENILNTKDLDEKLTESVARRLRDASLILELTQSTNTDGLFPQTYEQRNGNPRFTGMGVSLQNVCKDLRRTALDGYYSVDIECCHHVILEAFSRRYNIDCPVLGEMITDRTKFRNTLANDIGVDIETIKKALLVIVYGGRFQWVDNGTKPNWALRELLGEQKQRNLREHPKFKALYSEIHKLFAVIIDNHKPKQGHQGRIQNALLQLLNKEYRCPSTGALRPVKASQKLAFLLQGVESQAMQAMLKRAPRPLVVIHDGIVCGEQISITEEDRMIEQMKADTGIDFRLEIEQIAAPDWS